MLVSPIHRSRLLLAFSSRFQELWRESGISTQTELAKRSGISQQIISAYLAAEKLPGAHHLCRLADLFGVSTDYLLALTTVRVRLPDVGGYIGSDAAVARARSGRGPGGEIPAYCVPADVRVVSKEEVDALVGRRRPNGAGKADS